VPEGLHFLRSTAHRARDHKNLMRTSDFKDRLSAASAAKKAQIERARAISEDPERLKRIDARSETIAARNIRIAERERRQREAIAREAAQREAAEAAEAAARAAARKAEEEARAARLVEQARRDAAAAAEREAILAIRRTGRKAKKRRGH
jgi:translation initiation factor IF-2